MADDLTFTEKSVLLILMAEAREVPNIVLANEYRVKLATASRDKLKRRGLITTRAESRRLYLELADAGWKRCMEEFDNPVPAGAGAGGAALYALLGRVKTYLGNADVSYDSFFAPTETIVARPMAGSASAPLAAVAPPPPVAARARFTAAEIETRIRGAYTQLARRPGDMVSLADLRDRLGDVDRTDVDQVLVSMTRAAGVTISPESNQKMLQARHRAAAVSIGNQDKHLLAIRS